MAQGFLDETLLAADPGKQAPARAFRRRTTMTLEPPALPDLINAIAELVLPLMRAVGHGAIFELSGQAKGSWR